MEFLTSVLSGGITGLLGSILTKGIGLFEAYQKRQDMKLQFAQELELLDRQAKIRATETEGEAMVAREEASANIRMASYQMDDGGASYPWVAAVLRLVRPALTLVLVALVTIIYTTNHDLGSRAELQAAVIYMASSAVLWWFGDRAMTTRK